MVWVGLHRGAHCPRCNEPSGVPLARAVKKPLMREHKRFAVFSANFRFYQVRAFWLRALLHPILQKPILAARAIAPLFGQSLTS